MASFYAELWLEGYKFPLRTCTYGVSQATDHRGRVISKVRTSLIDCLLDVPEPPILTDWATDPTKQLPGKIVFFAAQGGAALETVAWAAAWCVGYQEDFISGDQNEGAYVCRIHIAAPVIEMLAGGPGGYAAPPAGTHPEPQQAGAPVLERVVETAKAVEVVETVTGWTVLTRLAQGLTRLLTSAPALTAMLVFTPTNSRDDDGYKAEWDLSRLTQAPTDKDRARLAYLEAEQAQRALTNTEADELASLLAVVRKVFVGGRVGLPFYYAQQGKASKGSVEIQPVVRDATKEEAALITSIRKTHTISKKKNVAYIEGILNGKPYYAEAHSGTNSKPGTAPVKLPTLQQIKTRPTSADIARGVTDADVRAYDSEVKILEALLDQTADNPEASGTLKIVSERPICESCWDGISQFERMRPNLKIERVQLPKP